MNRYRFLSFAAFLAILVISIPAAFAQEAEPPAMAQQDLDSMVAPIALYPDPLIADILMAATYPLEVVEAYRWQQDPENSGLQGEDLAAALEQQSWDPSVKSLVAFPQVLATLNDNLQWTEHLGDAFLDQEGAVMDSVQRLRHQAMAAGVLASTPQQTVATQGPDITIEPVSPNMVYVPTYNPDAAYGTWPYPSEPPYAFEDNYAPAGVVIAYEPAVPVIDVLWRWNRWDWMHHRILIDNRRFVDLNHGRAPEHSGTWQHDPGHRDGVPYHDTAARARFSAPVSLEVRRTTRGYAEPGPAIGNKVNWHANEQAPIQHPIVNDTPMNNTARAGTPRHEMRQQSVPTTRQATPVFESFSRGNDTRAQSERGAHSRSEQPEQPQGQATPSHDARGWRDRQ